MDPSEKRFEIEHAISTYALSYIALPAAAIYEKARLEPLADLIQKCHVYFIGLAPRVRAGSINQRGRVLHIPMSALGQRTVVEVGLADGVDFDSSNGLLIRQADGATHELDTLWLTSRLSDKMPLDFEVLYIGQAYGSDGGRNAIDRLIKHETLQKIALNGVPEGWDLMLLLVEVLSDNRVMIVINPHAQTSDDDNARANAGMAKLIETPYHELVSLYEAAMIRYFRPRFNIAFKDSFPSTNLKVLTDCYEKDFSGLVAEFVFDDFPWRLKSETVAPSFFHIAYHDLHTEQARTLFFNSDPSLGLDILRAPDSAPHT
ncbi:hypothetical protein DFR29_12818 [Tahibacter aquaticus]|uniref:Uncharacterized protein n=1 Tax=Tahibacter aquaticus TaxID=520092 RepID=A0A4R6YIB7_9GAMM|nr:hypothetical protein [Tahibacter aquaticus]TDR36597.1 hypothetical protein DFR29_12818 [Tahibacter aquaticus]